MIELIAYIWLIMTAIFSMIPQVGCADYAKINDENVYTRWWLNIISILIGILGFYLRPRY